jgi:hypothetical protein
MKIKLIIILFSISCLFFPAGLMEAEAYIPIGPILKGVKELIEHTPGIVKVQTGKITFLQAKKNWCLQNPESCTANNEIMYTELSLDKYGIKSIQTPSSWPPHDFGSFTDDDGFRQDMLVFTDDPSNINANGFSLLVWSFEDRKKLQKVDAKTLQEGFVQSMNEECDGDFVGPKNFETACLNFQIIESEGDANRLTMKYTMKEKYSAYSQYEEVLGKIVFIQEGRFVYMFSFGSESSEFASNVAVFDHIENTFVTNHQYYWQGIWGLIAIIITIGLIIAFVAWRITSSKKSKKKTKKKN